MLYLGDHITYHISPVEKKITAYASDTTLVESTIINLPFAVFAMSQNALLLHTSVLVNNNKLIPICASKGTGKTTLSAAMSKYFPLFSDDTLFVNLRDGNITTFSGSTVLKMFHDSASMLSLTPTSDKVNIQNKGYYTPINIANSKIEQGTNYKLSDLFFLSREDRQAFLIEEITLQYLKDIYLHANICGAEVLGYEYCKYIKSSSLFKKLTSELRFYKMVIPNNLSRLPRIAEETVKMIKNIVSINDNNII